VLKKFFAMGANKPFSRSAFWRVVKRAVQKANAARERDGLPLIDQSLRPKDWTRHTLGTETYRRTGDLKMVQELLGHSDLAQSEIYAEAAVREHLIAAVTELDKHARPRPYHGKVSPPLKGRSVRTQRKRIGRNAQ
jgi:site-specific recombinase XerD